MEEHAVTIIIFHRAIKLSSGEDSSSRPHPSTIDCV